MKLFNNDIDRQLILQASKGNRCAMESIYRHYANDSFKLAYKITWDKLKAEEITQDAFIRVFQNIVSYQFEGSFSGWIRKIVVNEALSRIRKESKLELLIADSEEVIDDGQIFQSNWQASYRDLNLLLNELPNMYRVVIVLHEIEGYTHKEIAAMLNKSESYSKMTLLRAFKQLREFTIQEEKNYALK